MIEKTEISDVFNFTRNIQNFQEKLGKRDFRYSKQRERERKHRLLPFLQKVSLNNSTIYFSHLKIYN